MFPKCGLELIGTNEVVDVRKLMLILPKLPSSLGWVEIASPGCLKQSDDSSLTVSRLEKLNLGLSFDGVGGSKLANFKYPL